MIKFNLNLLSILPLILHAISTAEGMKGATGAEKKAAAIDLVRTGLAGVETVSGKHVLDIPEAEAAVSSGIDAAVHAVNAVKKAQGK